MRRWIRLGVALAVAGALAVVPASGLGPFAAPCASAAPEGASFVGVSPTRVLDTRTGPGPLGKVAGGQTITVDLSAAVPADATAVALNVTGVEATAANFVTVWPAGTPRPTASNLNLVPGQALSNAVTVGLGTGSAARRISLFTNAGAVNLIADLAGYYRPGTTGAGFTPRPPLRALDTRTPTGGNQGTVGTGRTIDLDLGAQVPPTTSAVVMVVTATDVTAPTFVTAFPTGSARPNASTLNLAKGDVRANLATVATGPGGRVSFYNLNGSVNLVADVAGYFAPGTGGLFVPIAPTRVLDTRDGTGAPAARVGGGDRLAVSTASAVPTAGNAAVVNLTGVSPTTSTFVTAWPHGTARPLASNLNLAPRDVIPVLASVALGDRQFDLFNQSGQVDLVGDVSGYYVPRPGCGGTAPAPARIGVAPGPGDASVPAGTQGRAGGGEQSQIDQREGAPNE